MSASNSFSFLFSVFPSLSIAIFALVVAVFISILVRGARQQHKNDHSPRLTVPAKVIGKRTQLSFNTSVPSSRYFVTFQFDSGDRQEFPLSANEYALLAEGDIGFLSFQGTRYLDFKRR